MRVETLSHDAAVGAEKLQSLESPVDPVEMGDGRSRVSALPRSNTGVRALLNALIGCHLISGGLQVLLDHTRRHFVENLARNWAEQDLEGAIHWAKSLCGTLRSEALEA